MNPIVTSNDAIERLFDRINYERQAKVAPSDFKLSNMLRFLEQLGNPQFDCPVIHVAGTKGKGSVSAIISSILAAAGYRTGVYSSPHLERVNQRIVVGGQEIDDRDLRTVLGKLQPAIDRSDKVAEQSNWKKLTFFEIITAAAFQYFSDQKLDAVVLEVGMGGRLDSTNVCKPDVCVITNISFDHTRQLGSTLEQIAGEKAGIIKPGIPIVSGVEDALPRNVIEQIANKNDSRLFQIGSDFRCISDSNEFRSFKYSSYGRENGFKIENLVCGMHGAHQQKNAAIAIAAIEQLISQSWKISTDDIRSGIQLASLPGRCELFSDRPLVVLDMAHNEASTAALAKTLSSEIPAFNDAEKRTLIFAAGKEKDVSAMLRPLIDLFDQVVVTQFQNNPRARSIDELATAAERLIEQSGQATDLIRIDSPLAAFERVSANLPPNHAVCITGSAFLIAELRPIAAKTWNNR